MANTSEDLAFGRNKGPRVVSDPKAEHEAYLERIGAKKDGGDVENGAAKAAGFESTVDAVRHGATVEQSRPLAYSEQAEQQQQESAREGAERTGVQSGDDAAKAVSDAQTATKEEAGKNPAPGLRTQGEEDAATTKSGESPSTSTGQVKPASGNTAASTKADEKKGEEKK